MDEAKVKRFLQYPAAQLVDMAVDMANLTEKEHMAVNSCARQGKTQERAAEDYQFSVDAFHRWYRSGMRKLCTAWDCVCWIEKLIE